MDYREDGGADSVKTIPNTSDANLDQNKFHVLLCDKDPELGLRAMKLNQQCLYHGKCKSI